jgi:hypothetical protein
MGKVKDSIIVEGLSGQVGGVLLKNYRYGTVISKMPDRSKVKLTIHQKKLNTNFQQGVEYARSIINDPVKKKQFEKQARRKHTSVYHYVLAQYLKGNKL